MGKEPRVLARLRLAFSVGALALSLIALFTIVRTVHEHGAFTGDDLVAFWQARRMPLSQYLFHPIDVHFVPMHRLVSWIASEWMHLDYDVGTATLLGLHLMACGALYVLCRAALPHDLTLGLLCLYSLHPCLGSLFMWWTSGLHRLGYVAFASVTLALYVQHRKSGGVRWLIPLFFAAIASVGFYEKGLLIPVYLIALEVSLCAAFGATPRSRTALLSALGACGAVGLAHVYLWHRATEHAMQSANLSPLFLFNFAELGTRLFASTVIGYWMDPRLPVWIQVGLAWSLAALVLGAFSWRALVPFATIVLLVASNMAFIGASGAKSSLFGYALLWADRYYFESMFLVVIFGAIALGAASHGPLPGAVPWLGRLAAIVALATLVGRSGSAFDGIRRASYANSDPANAYFVRLRSGLHRLQPEDRQLVPLRDTRVSPSLMTFGYEVAHSSQILALLGEHSKTSKHGRYEIDERGNVKDVSRGKRATATLASTR